MPHIEANGQVLHYEDSGGPGPAVVLCHGFLMDLSMFRPQVEALADSHRVITWDQRGFGSTKYDGRPFTFWDSARDCLALMDDLSVATATVGGMSQGGFVALRTALLAPDRVRALVLLNSEAGVFDLEEKVANDRLRDRWLSEGPTVELTREVASAIIADPRLESDWARKWQANWAGLRRFEFAVPYVCLATREDLTSELASITCPALVIHGRDDAAIPIDKGRQLAVGLPGCPDLVSVEGGHAASFTNPGPVNEAIKGLLLSLGRD